MQETAVKESQSTAGVKARSAKFFLASDWLCLVIAIANAVVGAAMIRRFLHGAGWALGLLALSAVIAGAMVWLRWIQLRGITLGRKWLVAAWCLFVVLFAVLFPLSHRHLVGGGSDRDDALRAAAAALVHGQYPYYAKTYLGNAISPLPGAIILATPFYLLGNVSLQNCVWLAVFLWFGSVYFRERSTAVLVVLLTLGSALVNLDDFVVGGDFFINAIYVAVALYLVLMAYEKNRPLIQQIGACILLGLAVDSRPTYIVAFPLLAAYLWQRRGASAAFRAVLITAFVAGISSIPFYLYDPANFTPLHLTHKLDVIQATFRPTVVLPVGGFLVACAAFVVRLCVQRVYLILGLSMLVMSGVPGLWGWLRVGWLTLAGWYWLGWATLPFFFLLLWSMRVYEENSRVLREAAAR